MKKLIGTVALAALLAGSAFAEITFGSWVRVIAAPVASDGEDILAGMDNSWGGVAWGGPSRVARLDINAQSEDGKAGFAMGVWNHLSNGIGPSDNQALWVKPWDFLKVSLGVWDYTTFRGDLCYGSWNWLRPQGKAWFVDDEGLTFDKLGAKQGLQLELTPVEGLLVMYNLPLGNGFSDGESKNLAYKAFQGQDIAAKYTIGDIGTIKAGWGGNAEGYKGDAQYLGNVNVAFDLTAVENLYVTVGARIAIANDDWKKDAWGEGYDKDFQFLKVALGASYQILDNLKLSASFAMLTYENRDPDLQFGVGLDVGLTDALTLNADFRGRFEGGIDKDTYKYDPDPIFSFLVGLNYACSSNGSIGIGFQGTTNGCGFVDMAAHDSDSFCWAVPIAVSVWF